MGSSGSFMTDIQTLRQRARAHIESGAVTAGYGADRETAVKLLNEALATELVCVLRYKRHYFMASGINAQSVAQEFLEHAAEEQAHADQIAERIVQVRGEPNLSPEGLPGRSHAEYVEGTDLIDMIREDMGEIRRDSEEHQWRRRLTGSILTLRCERVGSKQD